MFRVARSFAFQACLIDRSSISPFRINELRAVWNSVAQTLLHEYLIRDVLSFQSFAETQRHDEHRNCVRPSNLTRALTGIWLSH